MKKILLLLFCHLYGMTFAQYEVSAEKILSSKNTAALTPFMYKLSNGNYVATSGSYCFMLDSTSLDTLWTRELSGYNQQFCEISSGRYLITPKNADGLTHFTVVDDDGQVLKDEVLPMEFVMSILTKDNYIYIGGSLNVNTRLKPQKSIYKLTMDLDTVWTSYSADDIKNGVHEMFLDSKGDLVALTKDNQLLKLDTATGGIKMSKKMNKNIAGHIYYKYKNKKIKQISNTYVAEGDWNTGIYLLDDTFNILDSLRKFPAPNVSSGEIVKDTIYFLGSYLSNDQDILYWRIYKYNSNLMLLDSISFVVDKEIGSFGIKSSVIKEKDGNFVISTAYGATNLFKVMRVSKSILSSTLDSQADVSEALYPNPTDGVFIIKGMPSGQPLEIYNALGAHICSKNISDQGLIDTNDLGNGLYLVRYEQKTFKLLKQSK